MSIGPVQNPSPLPSGGDSKAGATSATNSASGGIKGGNWSASSKSECDKGYSACDKEVIADLAKVKEDCQTFLSDLLSGASLNIQVKHATTLVNDRSKLRDDVAKLIAASPAEGQVLSNNGAVQVGETIKTNYSNPHDPDNYPEYFITVSVNEALHLRRNED